MPGTSFPTTFTSNERANSKPVHLYTFARGPSIWRYTDAPLDVTVNGVAYRAAAIQHGALDRDEESAAGECVVSCAMVTPIVTALDAIGLAGSPVICTIRQTHETGVGGVSSVTTATRYKGRVKTRTVADGVASFRCASLAAELEKPLLRVTCQPTCNWVVYGAECGVDPAGFTDGPFPLTDITDLTLTCPDAASQADDYYTAGYLTVVTGTAAGERAQIQTHTGDTLTILTALPPGLTVSDTVSLTAGCDGLEATCAAKFNNLDYFVGFPRVPNVNPFLRAE